MLCSPLSFVCAFPCFSFPLPSFLTLSPFLMLLSPLTLVPPLFCVNSVSPSFPHSLLPVSYLFVHPFHLLSLVCVLTLSLFSFTFNVLHYSITCVSLFSLLHYSLSSVFLFLPLFVILFLYSTSYLPLLVFPSHFLSSLSPTTSLLPLHVFPSLPSSHFHSL